MTDPNIFNAIAAVAQLGMTIAVGFGVAVAYWQLRATRQAVANNRKAELAEEMVVLAGQVQDAFKHMRNPFDSIPLDKIHDKEFQYKRRYERVLEPNSLFSKLRETQIRFDAAIGKDKIRKHVTELFNARDDIAMAIETILDMETKEGVSRDREVLTKARRTLYGSWGDRDEFGQKIKFELSEIREKAGPYASWTKQKT